MMIAVELVLMCKDMTHPAPHESLSLNPPPLAASGYDGQLYSIQCLAQFSNLDPASVL